MNTKMLLASAFAIAVLMSVAGAQITHPITPITTHPITPSRFGQSLTTLQSFSIVSYTLSPLTCLGVICHYTISITNSTGTHQIGTYIIRNLDNTANELALQSDNAQLHINNYATLLAYQANESQATPITIGQSETTIISTFLQSLNGIV